MMSDKKNDPNEKGRYWAGLIYPGDSAPDNWQELMQLSGLQILVSPLHDQDIADVKTGELKKPHRHVVAMWMNPDLLDYATRQTVFCREVIWSYWHASSDKPKKEPDHD